MKKFWSKVEKGGSTYGCWQWTAGKTGLGYGQFCHDGITEYAHRYSARLAGMQIDGHVVMHSCDNPSCVNPRHLTIGRQADNMADMKAKGRGNGARGERNKNSKLTLKEVNEIRIASAFGVSQRELGRRYGVSHKGIAYVLKEGWK